MGDSAADPLLAGLEDEVGSIGSQDTTDTDTDTEAEIEAVRRSSCTCATSCSAHEHVTASCMHTLATIACVAHAAGVSL